MATNRDYYEILGVSKTATQDEIKSAFRKKAKSCHPDINKTPEAEAQFKELGEAYSVLSDETKRRQYDQFGKSAFDGSMGGGAGGYGGAYGNYSFDDIDLSEVFKEFFGGSSYSSFFGGGARGKKNRPVRGSDTLVRMNLTFEEAAFGSKKTLKLDLEDDCPECDGKGGHGEKTCPDCEGKGRVTMAQRSIFGVFQTETTCSRCNGAGHIFDTTCSKCRGNGRVSTNKEIVVNVPIGINDGEKIRISGKGEAGYNGGENGDLYIEFNVKEHPLFKRDGNDIYIEMPLTIAEATLGCKKEIPTIEENVILTISSGTQNGDKYKLRGKGIDGANMFVVCNVVIPSKLSGEQKRLFKELNETSLDNDSEFKKFNSYLK